MATGVPFSVAISSLALAILLAVTDEVTAERFYQKFKRDVLSLIEADRWTLDAGDVRRVGSVRPLGATVSHLDGPATA